MYVIVLIWLSAAHPCPPASAPTPGCLDGMVRMDTTMTVARCERLAAWWRRHIQDHISADHDGDTGTAVCVKEPSQGEQER